MSNTKARKKTAVSQSSKLTTAALSKALLELIPTGKLDSVLTKALDRLFAEGKWEIPDDAVAGHIADKLKRIDARLNGIATGSHSRISLN
jgi:hypothetical protein